MSSFIKIAITVIIVAGGAFYFLGESGNPSPVNTPTTSPIVLDESAATPAGIASIEQGSDQFAFELYQNLREKETGKNIFFSPYSISTALSMVYEGARGETADEIRSVFHLPEDDTTRRSSVAAIYNRLNPKNASYQLKTANALWVQNDHPIHSDYTDILANYYGGKATNLDFVNATESARQTINSWVEDQTNNKIKNLFRKGTILPATRLVLTNAIYFKGTWADQFKKEDTYDDDFHVTDDKTTTAHMMQRTGEDAKYNYDENDIAQVLELPYEGDDLSMLVVLPKENDLKKIEDTLSLETLDGWRSALREQRVDVYIPKFTFSSKYTLNDNLSNLGMPLAFTAPTPTGGADLTGITDERELFIGLVVHQAFIDVNEEGTEAAAATGISLLPTSMPIDIPVFRADHPFIFIIQEKKSGHILFMGRVIDPTA